MPCMYSNYYSMEPFFNMIEIEIILNKQLSDIHIML